MGETTTCAIGADASLWCWGRSGKTFHPGDEIDSEYASPTPVAAGTTWRQIAVSLQNPLYLCGIQTDGSLWCWGTNGLGQLGDGETNTFQTAPERIGTSTDWAFIGTGNAHTCGLQSDGSLWCWGDGTFGQIGNGALAQVDTPQRVGTDKDWVVLAVGSLNNCGIRSDRSLWCWGYNLGGAVGDGTTAPAVTSPTQVGVGFQWNQVSTDSPHTCAVDSLGQLWCWGTNISGALGDGTTVTHDQPELIAPGPFWSNPKVAGISSCALQDDSTLWCWGGNNDGQLGDGTKDERDSPERIGTADDWYFLALSETYGCAIDANASLWCWGSNEDGQLGLGPDAPSELTAQQVP